MITTTTLIKPPPLPPEVADHPAKFSIEVMETAHSLLFPLVQRERVRSILDPFAGVGRCHFVADQLAFHTGKPVVSVGLELQPRWARADRRTLVGNVLALGPLGAHAFDAVFTSPCYGNRMADHHNAKDQCQGCGGTGFVKVPSMLTSTVKCGRCNGKGGLSRRNTYTHRHGEPLDPLNSGAMHWGPVYRAFHGGAWQAVTEACADHAWFVLNISDHYKTRKVRGVKTTERQPVTDFHVGVLEGLGWKQREWIDVETKRNKQGANSSMRADCEHVIMFERGR